MSFVLQFLLSLNLTCNVLFLRHFEFLCLTNALICLKSSIGRYLITKEFVSMPFENKQKIWKITKAGKISFSQMILHIFCRNKYPRTWQTPINLTVLYTYVYIVIDQVAFCFKYSRHLHKRLMFTGTNRTPRALQLI